MFYKIKSPECIEQYLSKNGVTEVTIIIDGATHVLFDEEPVFKVEIIKKYEECELDSFDLIYAELEKALIEIEKLKIRLDIGNNNAVFTMTKDEQLDNVPEHSLEQIREFHLS
jgi:hypothetical protein